VDVETRIRIRKRDAVRRTALAELDDRFEELRHELTHALQDFEERVDACIESLPDWAGDELDDVDDAFQIQVGKGDPVRVGPRAAAVLAARLEEWAQIWLSPDGEGPEDGFDDDAGQKWADELDELDDALSQLEREARGAATAAGESLGGKLDELLANLEADREEGEEALEKAVAEGDVDAGEEAREREAKLWEEQRKKAAEVREAWEPLEELAFEGAETTVEYVAVMREILETAVDSMLTAYPELREPARDWVKSDAKRIFKIQPPPKRQKTRDPNSPSFDIDEPRRKTEPLGENRTEEYPRTAPATPAPVPRNTPAPPAREHPTSWDEAVFRVWKGWEAVVWTEIALVAGPPAAYTAFLAAVTLAYWGGALTDNPFHRWAWAFPVFAGLAAYGLVVPLFLQWRVRWTAGRPHIVRWEEHRRDAVLRIGTDAVELGEQKIHYRTGSARRGERDDGLGERLRILGPSGDELVVESGPRSEAWGVTAQTLERLHERFVRR
jgi:hypothetical protein